MLLGDTVAAKIYAMDVETGTVSTLMEGVEGVEGVNGLQVDGGGKEGRVYWANHDAKTLNRVKVKAETNELVVQGQPLDDFALAGKKKAYVGAMFENEVGGGWVWEDGREKGRGREYQRDRDRVRCRRGVWEE